MQRLCTNPDFLLDGGHNPQCVQAATEALKAFYPDKKVVFLTGMMQDKDTDRMLEEMVPLAARNLSVFIRTASAQWIKMICAAC